MRLDEECKACLYGSQMKKVESRQTDGVKTALFRARVKQLCTNPPENYCAPLLMRDIDGVHREIFGCGIDYSREKQLFNSQMSELEDGLFSRIMSSADPLKEGLKYAGAANYIDFARLSGLGEGAIGHVMSVAERAVIEEKTLRLFSEKLQNAHTLCVIHDNCGEIVLDKILIRAIRELYPQIRVTSVVRGYPILNDATYEDAHAIGLDRYSEVVGNGTGIPGTYLAETAPEIAALLGGSDVILSKGLGNLETLYGGGYAIFYSFNCKCRHIAERFNLPLWSAAFIYGTE